MTAPSWGDMLVETVRRIAGDDAADKMRRHQSNLGPTRLFPDDSGFERPTFTDAEYDEASDRGEARDTAQREWRAR